MTAQTSTTTGRNRYHHNHRSSRRRRSERKRLRKARVDEPLLLTVFKVGTTLMVICGITYLCFLRRFFASYSRHVREDYIVNREPRLIIDGTDMTQDTSHIIFDKPTSLGGWSKDTDVFGVVSTYFRDGDSATASVPEADLKSIRAFRETAQVLRKTFAQHYGGRRSVRSLLSQSLSVLREDTMKPLSSLTKRLIQASSNGGGTFHMAFTGTSPTAGYGNHHEESFPFILQQLLAQPFQQLLGLELKVSNAAMNGISVFPYSWCLDSFFGTDPVDVVYGDFGEETSAQSLEAFIRQTVSRSHRPMMIFRDFPKGGKKRLAMIQNYVDAGVLLDPLLVRLISPPTDHLDVTPGFQNWTQYGGPPTTPGRAPPNLSTQQHELLAWLVAMHFLNAMQLAVVEKLNPGSVLLDNDEASLPTLLPPPFSTLRNHHLTWASLLHGSPLQVEGETNGSNWFVNHLRCRTMFEPVIKKSGSLQELVVSGTAADYVDLMLPKGPMYYNRGWIPDMDPDDKKEKLIIKEFGFLGFVDVKKGLYGVPASGSLQLFLPYEDQQTYSIADGLNSTWSNSLHPISESLEVDPHVACNYFKSIVVCESSSQRGDFSCNLATDVTFTVGGEDFFIDTDAVSYLDKRLCVLISVPKKARLTTRREMKGNTRKFVDRKLKPGTDEKEPIGISLQLNVTQPRVRWEKGACSVAHVLWEQIRPEGKATRNPRQNMNG